jgi:hypothetical protein
MCGPGFWGLGLAKPHAELWAKARPKLQLGLGSTTALKNKMTQNSIY